MNYVTQNSSNFPPFKSLSSDSELGRPISSSSYETSRPACRDEQPKLIPTDSTNSDQ